MGHSKIKKFFGGTTVVYVTWAGMYIYFTPSSCKSLDPSK